MRIDGLRAKLRGRCAELQSHFLLLKVTAHPLFMFATSPRSRIFKMCVRD